MLPLVPCLLSPFSLLAFQAAGLQAAPLQEAPGASDTDRAPRRADVHPTRLLLSAAAGQTDQARRAALARAGARELLHLPQIGWTVVEVAAGELHRARRRLARERAFDGAYLDRARTAAYVPNDPLWTGMWHMQQIDAHLAWDLERGSSDVEIAVVDTGVELVHPDLQPNLWVNPAEIPANGLDDDGNGYVDDVNGWDFAYLDPDPDDAFGHGTSCAGVAAAVQDNFLGGTGVAPGCRIVAVKAALDNGLFYDSAIVPALVYCADMGFEVVSMSFFSDDVTPAELDAVKYAWRKGSLLVAAAGNGDSVIPFYPAAYERVIAVGATQNAFDQRAFFSSYGTWIDVAAPGISVSTATTGGGFTSAFSGTSAACPHVSGLAALLFSASPGATNHEVRAALEDTALLLDEPGVGQWAGYGRIDADDALLRVTGATSGQVAPRVEFAAPCGGIVGTGVARGGRLGWLPELSFVGRGFEPPRQARILADGQLLPPRLQGRQRVSAFMRGLSPGALIELELDGQVAGSFVWDYADGMLYGATDAGTDGSGSPVALGCFAELHRTDGNLFTCTRSSTGGGQVFVEFAVRGLRWRTFATMAVEFTRSYVDCDGGTETLEIYDWQSASYPYGNWVTLSTRTVGSTVEALSLPVPVPRRFVDDAGTVYLRLTTSGAGPAGRLEADQLRLRVR